MFISLLSLSSTRLDIYLAGHRFEDEGLAVFFEPFDLSQLCGYQVVNLLCLVVKEVGDLGCLGILPPESPPQGFSGKVRIYLI